MKIHGLLRRLDREGLRVIWRRHGDDVTCCEHKEMFGPVGFGETWFEALEDFLRRRDAR